MEYTDEQLDAIDRLVAERVMGWKPGEMCPGGGPDAEVGELPISADGWFCYECGYQGKWGDGSYEHERLYPSYTRRRGAAMQVFEKCGDMNLSHCTGGYIAWQDNEAGDPWWNKWRGEADTPMLALCLAALARAGVDLSHD